MMNAKDLIVHGIMELAAHRDAALAEVAALREQLAECREHRNQLRSAFTLAADNPDIPEYIRDAMRDTLAVTVRRMTTGINGVVMAEQHILPPEVAARLHDDDWLDAEPVHLDRHGNVRKFEVRWSE